MGSTYSLVLAAVVVTLRGGVVMGVAVDENDCTKSLPRCMAKAGGNCDHCTHVQTKNRMLWQWRSAVLPLCLTFDNWSMMWEDYGSTNNCFSSDWVYCTSSTSEHCYVDFAKGKAAVTGSKSGAWNPIQLRDPEDRPLPQWVHGVMTVGYQEVRAGQGMFGDALRNVLGTTRGFAIDVNNRCTDCPARCSFDPIIAVYAILPDPHKNKYYTDGKNGPEEFYSTVAPRVAAQSELLMTFWADSLFCLAVTMPAPEVSIRWRGTKFTFVLLPMLNDNQHTCNEWSGSTSLCKAGQYLTLDDTRCIGTDHCRHVCCSCGGDNYYYADSCPYYVQQGYCQHTYVDWMNHHCAGSCCKAASG